MRELVAAKVSSPEQLDVFLLLYRAQARTWTPTQVAEALDMAPQSAGMRLFLLASAGLIEATDARDPEYRYVSSPGLDPLADLTVAAYESDRDTLYEIAGKPAPDPVRDFADAFKLRKP